MRKAGFIISILISSIFCVSAQNEGNIWYFGYNAGLDFNSGAPVALGDGQLYTLEGCATIADNNGNLLFYTDGMTVYNKNHTIMQNGTGLLGHNSSTQSAIIVRKPGSTNIYYIFTVDGYSGRGYGGNNQGLNYSEVDMTLDGGLGDITTNKNILLIPATCEKVTAIKHQNNSDFWIISRLENSNTYHSYLLTCSGVNTTPVITNIGDVYNMTAGYLKASPNGSRIAAANVDYEPSSAGGFDINLCDFDNNTGLLSNLISLEGVGATRGPYGLEFSPNGNILYITARPKSASNNFNSPMFQYDLLAGSPTAIVNSRIKIYTGGIDDFGAIQLAPDGKIYHVLYQRAYLGVINNPNIVGSGCNYNPNGCQLAPGTYGGGGLPTFYSSIFNNNSCYGDSTFFNSTNTSADSVLWDFGDPNSGTHNSSTEINPFHIFSASGIFHITSYSYFNGMVDTIVNDLFVTAIPILNLGNDTVVCEGEVLTLDATSQNSICNTTTYLWQDNSTDSTYTVSTEGEYFVNITVNGCSNTDTINVTYNALPNAIISGDYEVCYGEKVFIDVNLTGSSPFEITYTNGTNTNIAYGNESIIIEANQSGIYEITNVADQFDCIGNYSGSAEIIINPCSLIIYTPNIFTPNSDAINEGFIPSIYDIDDVVTFHMQIFNRWGDMIYETNKKEEYWDGTFNNTAAQQGVYGYIITITDIYDVSHDLNGYVCLIR